MTTKWTDAKLETYLEQLQTLFASKEKFKQFSMNSSQDILALKNTDTINGTSISDLNHMLQPSSAVDHEKLPTHFSDTSSEGFIQKGDDIRTIMAKDTDTVQQQHMTHAELIMPFIRMALTRQQTKQTIFKIGDRTITARKSEGGRDSQQHPMLQEDDVKLKQAMFKTFGVAALLNVHWGIFGTLEGMVIVREHAITGSVIRRKRLDEVSDWLKPFVAFAEKHLKEKVDGKTYDEFMQMEDYRSSEWILPEDALEELAVLVGPEPNATIMHMVKRQMRLVPFDDPLIFSDGVHEVFVHELTVALILQFGFYQNGKYRTPPEDLLKVLGKWPGEEDESKQVTVITPRDLAQGLFFRLVTAMHETYTYRCDGCSAKDIVDFHFCVTCRDVDLCAACHEKKPFVSGHNHDTHELVSINGAGARNYRIACSRAVAEGKALPSRTDF